MDDRLSARLRQTGLSATCADRCTGLIETVTNGGRWVRRFEEICLAVDAGTEQHRRLDNHLFELKAMSHFVDLGIGKLTYEPEGRPGGKNCDVLIETAQERVLVELKAFHPTEKSKAIPYKYITPGNVLDMDPDLYHQFQSTRGHLLDVAFDVEDKLDSYPDPKRGVMAVLVDFYLGLEDYRDFVAVYRGCPRLDDPLATMSQHALRARTYKRSIDEFWSLPFDQFGCDFKPGSAALVVEPQEDQDRPILRS
jgi:hypothetical protein